jgi:hypothetical protein
MNLIETEPRQGTCILLIPGDKVKGPKKAGKKVKDPNAKTETGKKVKRSVFVATY